MYFVLQSREPDDPEAPETASFSYERDVAERSWFRGQRFSSPPPLPVRVTTRGGTLPDLAEVPLPLASERLAAALRSAGVDNIDFYEAEIVDLGSGRSGRGYFAFNLIGLVAAADLSASVYLAPEGRLLSVDFDSLAIDAAKARGALMFRLAECVTCIVVHASVKQTIEAAGIDTVEFLDPADWVG